MTPFMPQDDNSITQDDNSIAHDDNSMVQDDNHVVVVPQVDSFLSCFKMTRPCHAERSEASFCHVSHKDKRF